MMILEDVCQGKLLEVNTHPFEEAEVQENLPKYSGSVAAPPTFPPLFGSELESWQRHPANTLNCLDPTHLPAQP